MLNTFIKSEQGSKAAWKGFSSQTTYIAYRLMLLNDNYEFYPEKIEDLMIKQGDSVLELVQVKNLSSDLALAHLSPKKNDSFFKRCLKYKEKNESIILRIISFGDIGMELQGLINRTPTYVSSIKSKLIEYGYISDEIDWIINKLQIDKVDEPSLITDINAILSDTIETMAAPKVAFDVLISYVSKLSRYGGHTSKTLWDNKIHEIAIDLSAVAGMSKQYGNTILPIFEYKDSLAYESLKEEYALGVNTLPQHIRANLDIIRSYWLDEIEAHFKVNSIVLIRGASGQGKSSIAYRFLLNNFPERDIICIEKITNEEQANDIRAALTGLAKSRGSQIVAYIDVRPYDTNWLWLCEQIFSHGTDIKLLITIREEDFRRVPIDHLKHRIAEIELKLSKEEALEIYSEYKTSRFLSFEAAWKSFGEEGPLMEFVYMLNQADTLKNRLSAQIDAIIQNESNADEWLKVLTIIGYTGKNNIRVDIAKLFTVLNCPQQRKMLSVFEKEYFIRTLENGRYLESLHALRASILYGILEDETLFPEKDVLLTALKSITDSAVMLIVEYIYKYNISDILVDEISTINYDSWTLYASVIKALLWGEVFSFYTNNKQIILEGDSLMNNTFIMFGVADVTGYFENLNFDSLFDIMRKQNPARKDAIDRLIKELTPARLKYYFIDKFFNLTIKSLPTNNSILLKELTSYGYALFWLAKRNFKLREPDDILFTEEINRNTADEYLNFLVGTQMQKWDNQYISIRKKLLPVLLDLFNIVYFKEVSREITAYFIIDIFTSNQQLKFHDRVISVVEMIRKLNINKDKYNVKMIGQNINEDIEIPDAEKHISADNLPFAWISQLNGWLIRLNQYTYMPPTWAEFVDNIIETRKSIMSAIRLIIEGVDYLYKKGNASKLISKDYKDIMKVASLYSSKSLEKPKCAMDKYGISLDNSVVDRTSFKLSLSDNQPKESKQFLSVYNKYCTDINTYLKQKDGLLVERIKISEISHESYLSLINIISALDNLSEMVLLYNEKFSSFQQRVDEKDEYNLLCTLAAIWNYIYNNDFRRGSSVSYNCKEYVKTYKKKLSKFFEQEISSINGVESFSKSHGIIRIIINSDYVDSFPREIFNEIKAKFPDIKTLSLHGVIFKEFFKEIHILFRLQNTLLPGGVCIPNRNFLIYDDVEVFIKRITPILESDNNGLGANPKSSALSIYGNLRSFPLLLKHSTQVNAELQLLEEPYRIEQIYKNWIVKTAELFKTVFDDIFYNLQFIFGTTTSDKSVTEPMYKQFMDAKKAIEENICDFVKTNNYDEALGLIDILESKITEFIDLFPSEAFDL